MAGWAVGYDSTRVNAGLMPRGAQIYMGYSTGSGYVPWSEAMFAAYAGPLGPCLRICQDATASDPHADGIDFERGTMPLSMIPGWVRDAEASFRAGARPGQRWPAVYACLDNITPVCNELQGAGITGCGLIIADWDLTMAAAAADLLRAGGPWPVVGYQITDPGPYDVDVFSTAWLARQSVKP